MRHLKKLMLTACLSMTASSALAAPPRLEARFEAVGQGRMLRAAGKHLPGEYIVVMKEKPGPGLRAMSDEAQELARRLGADVGHTFQHALRGFVLRANEAQARALAQDPRVDYVQENALVEPAGLQSPAPWHLDRIDQTALPLNNGYYADDATGINVYVVDSGIRTSHVEFEGRAQNVYNFFSAEANIDGHGHGTRTAALIGGKTWGVAKKVNLKSVRVTNMSGQATSASIAAGLDWVAQNASTPAIVNLSFATPTQDPTVEAAASAVLNRSGLLLVVAAGNSGQDGCDSSPGRLANAVTVGATDNGDMRWYNSNYGSCLDLFAPGVGIESASNASDTGAGVGDGTSWAAPQVAGAAAVLLSNGVPTSSIAATLVNDGNPGVVQDAGLFSPNVLLLKRPLATALTNGVGRSASDVKNSIKNFKIEVPSGRPSVTFSISGGTGDADLYVRYGQLPDTYVYNCRPLRAGNNESCTFTNPVAGTWYLQLRAFADYSTTVKGQY